eukprot:4263270-Pleurochrysis_carterae.AAC.1
MISLIYGPPSTRPSTRRQAHVILAHLRARGMSKQVKLKQSRLFRPNYAGASARPVDVDVQCRQSQRACRRASRRAGCKPGARPCHAASARAAAAADR